jgi:hypothetical protein
MFRRKMFEEGVGELMIPKNREFTDDSFVTVFVTVDCVNKNGRCKPLYFKCLQRP